MKYYSDVPISLFQKELNIKNSKKIINKIIILSDDVLKELPNTTNYFSGYKDLFLNKYNTYKALRKKSIATVPTKLYKTPFITKSKVITKPIDGYGRIKYLIWEKGEEIKCKDNMIIQPFVNGKEYNVDLLCDGINFISCIKEKLEIKAGRTWKCKEVDIPEIDNLLYNFVKEYPYYGSMDIDIIECNGKYMILDVNTRFGGGIMHSLNLNSKFKKELYNLIHINRYKLKTYKKKESKKISYYSFNVNLK